VVAAAADMEVVVDRCLGVFISSTFVKADMVNRSQLVAHSISQCRQDRLRFIEASRETKRDQFVCSGHALYQPTLVSEGNYLLPTSRERPCSDQRRRQKTRPKLFQ